MSGDEKTGGKDSGNKPRRGDSGGFESFENFEDTVSRGLRQIEHNPVSAKTILAVVLALPVLGIFTGGIVSYRYSQSLFDERIRELFPILAEPLDRRISSHDTEIGILNAKVENDHQRITNLENK